MSGFWPDSLDFKPPVRRPTYPQAGHSFVLIFGVVLNRPKETCSRIFIGRQQVFAYIFKVKCKYGIK